MKTITKILIALIFILSISGASAQTCSITINSVTSNGNGSYTFNVSTNNFNSGSFFASMWVDFGDGNYAYPSPNSTSFTHTYNNNGMYYFCVGIDDSLSACYSSDCDTIIVSTSPCNLAAGFSMSGTGPNQYTFTDYSTGTYNFDLWRIDDQFGSNILTQTNSASLSHTFTNNGFYTVTRKIVNSGPPYCADSTVQFIQVNNASGVCSAWFYAWPDSANPGVVDIWDLSYVNPVGAGSHWDMGDGTTYPYTNGAFATTITHNYASSGNYNICLYINDGNGCADTFCTNVFVPRYNMHNNVNSVHQAVIHPNPNGATGIKNTGSAINSVKTCPNPCTNELQISFESKENIQLQIAVKNSLGQTIFNSPYDVQTGNNQINLNTSTFESGIYFIQINDGKNKANCLKFIKQ